MAAAALAVVDPYVDASGSHAVCASDGSPVSLKRCPDGTTIFVRKLVEPAPPVVAPVKPRFVSLVGSTVAAYRLCSLLGRGGFGAVYKAVHVSTGEEVAIKVLNSGSRCEDSDQLLTEINCLMELRHPHIIELQQVINSSKTTALVLQLARGGDLAALLTTTHAPGQATRTDGRPGFQEDTARRMFSQILKAVLYAHNHGVVHRDLKLENILLAADGITCYLTDFGLSKFTANHAAEASSAGSLHYLAPEVILGRPHDGRCVDVWCLGVILYAMLTGVLPFRSSSVLIAAAALPAESRMPASSIDWEPLTGVSDKVCAVVPTTVIIKEVHAAICSGDLSMPAHISPAGAALLRWMLSPAPGDRPTPAQVLASAWQQAETVALLDLSDEPESDAFGVALGTGERVASTVVTSARSLSSMPSASTVISAASGASSRGRRASQVTRTDSSPRRDRLASRCSSMELSDRTLPASSSKELEDVESERSISPRRRRTVIDFSSVATRLQAVPSRHPKHADRPPLQVVTERRHTVAASLSGIAGMLGADAALPSPTSGASSTEASPVVPQLTLPKIRPIQRPGAVTTSHLTDVEACVPSTPASPCIPVSARGTISMHASYRPIGVTSPTARSPISELKVGSPASTPRITVAAMSGSAIPTTPAGIAGSLASVGARVFRLSAPLEREGSNCSSESSGSSGSRLGE